MGQKISKIQWRAIEEKALDEQKQFFSDWSKEFKIEPISCSSRDVKKGDHLMVYRYGYTHHLICTKVHRDQIMAMEYSGPPDRLELSDKEACRILVDLESLGEIHEKALTFEKLEEMEAQKITWPKKLRRFSAKKAVRRARSRKGEKKYNCLTNNCEHFVVWCICGLNVSLQVKIWMFWAKEVLKSLCTSTRDYMIQGGGRILGSFFLKVFANISDEIVAQIFSSQYSAFAVGFAIGSIIEGGLCFFEINKAFEDRESGDIPTDEELEFKVAEIIAKAVLRLGLGGAGSVIGYATWGLPGSLVGGVIGGMAGNILGKLAARWYCEKS